MTLGSSDESARVDGLPISLDLFRCVIKLVVYCLAFGDSDMILPSTPGLSRVCVVLGGDGDKLPLFFLFSIYFLRLYSSKRKFSFILFKELC